MPDPALIAELRLGGKVYTSWKTVSVRRNFGDSVSVFEFMAAEPTTSDGILPAFAAWRIKPGDPCEIRLAGIRVIKGFVTRRQTVLDAKNHTLIILGKSITADAADSSAQLGQYRGYSFAAIAASVLAPFGIQMLVDAAATAVAKPFKNVVVQVGETAHELLARLAMSRGLFLTDNADGNLVAAQMPAGGAKVADLVEGENILRIIATLDDQTLYSKYTAKGQDQGSDNGAPPRQSSATVENPNVRSSRINIFPAEHPGDSLDTAQRADMEARASLWPSVTVTCVVVGWLRPDGQLWQPTDAVTVKSPSCFPTDVQTMTLGVQSVIWAQSADFGTTTTLEMVQPGALTTVPNPGLSGKAPNLLSDPAPDQARPDAPDNGPSG